MKTILAIIVMLSVVPGLIANEEALLPDKINQILGRIKPNMSEAQVEKIVQTYYPNTKAILGRWSGQTGYVDFKITPQNKGVRS